MIGSSLLCLLCNPGVKEGKKLTPPEFPPSIYVGETARSICERGAEHWRGYKEKAEDSHIYKHHVIHHGGVGEPSFHLRPVRFFKTALSRQISEAVWIQMWGEERILNSRAEFNRCKIGRLTIGEEEDETKWRKMEQTGVGEEEEDLDQNKRSIKAWEKNVTQERRTQELKSTGRLERGLLTPPARKRLGEREDGADTMDSSLESSTSKKVRKKFKYPLLTNWGEEDTPPTPPSNIPHTPLRPTAPPRNVAEAITPSPANKDQLEDDLSQSKDDLLPGTGVVEATDSRRSREIDIKKQEQLEDRAEPQDMLNQPSSIGLVRSQGGDSTTGPPGLGLEARDNPGAYAEDLIGPRAQTSNTSQHQHNLEDKDITIARGPPTTITVNGVNLMNLQKPKKTGTSKEPGSKKKDKKKDQKKPTELTPSSGKITKYFVRKHREEGNIAEDNTYQEQDNSDILSLSLRRQEQELGEKTGGNSKENLNLKCDTSGMKTTFGQALCKENVRNKIARFEGMLNKEECVIASGMCGLHHCRVERDIVQKRVSSEDKHGNIQWTMREGTILVCPMARKPGIELDSNLLAVSQPELLGGTTNKKLRITLKNEDNESQHRNQI